jgi:hypothetical protein
MGQRADQGVRALELPDSGDVALVPAERDLVIVRMGADPMAAPVRLGNQGLAARPGDVLADDEEGREDRVGRENVENRRRDVGVRTVVER